MSETKDASDDSDSFNELVSLWADRVEKLKFELPYQHSEIKARTQAEIKGIRRCIKDLKKQANRVIDGKRP